MAAPPGDFYMWTIAFLMPWGICIDEARTLQLHACPRVWKLIRNMSVKNMHPQEDEVVHEILVSHPPLVCIFWLSLQFSWLSSSLDAFLTFPLLLQSICHFLHHHLHIQSLLSSLQTDRYLGKWRGPSNSLSCRSVRREVWAWMNELSPPKDQTRRENKQDW